MGAHHLEFLLHLFVPFYASFDEWRIGLPFCGVVYYYRQKKFSPKR